MLRLSVLDQSPIRAGGTAADAVAETLELKVVTTAYDFKARLRSHQLLAEVFGLPDRWSGHPLPEASA